MSPTAPHHPDASAPVEQAGLGRCPGRSLHSKKGFRETRRKRRRLLRYSQKSGGRRVEKKEQFRNGENPLDIFVFEAVACDIDENALHSDLLAWLADLGLKTNPNNRTINDPEKIETYIEEAVSRRDDWGMKSTAWWPRSTKRGSENARQHRPFPQMGCRLQVQAPCGRDRGGKCSVAGGAHGACHAGGDTASGGNRRRRYFPRDPAQPGLQSTNWNWLWETP